MAETRYQEVDADSGRPLAPSAPPEAMAPASTVTRQWDSPHPINIRLSIPLGFDRFYVTIVAGRERRSPDRQRKERRKHPLWTAGNLLFFAAIGSMIGLALFALMQLMLAFVVQEAGMTVPGL